MFRKSDAVSGVNKTSSSPSLFGSDLQLMGNIISEGDCDISATIQGNVRCRQLTLREGGRIEGEIEAEFAIINGYVKGVVKARRVQLGSKAYLEGSVLHETLMIEEGAEIDGKLKRVAYDDKHNGEATAEIKLLQNFKIVS